MSVVILTHASVNQRAEVTDEKMLAATLTRKPSDKGEG